MLMDILWWIAFICLVISVACLTLSVWAYGVYRRWW